MCTIVSKAFPRQILDEYPKTWTYNRTIQKIPSTNDILLPSVPVNNSLHSARQRSPIRNTINAMKYEWIYIICRLMTLTELNSSFQLKYFGKMKCRIASIINKDPVIFKCTSIIHK